MKIHGTLFYNLIIQLLTQFSFPYDCDWSIWMLIWLFLLLSLMCVIVILNIVSVISKFVLSWDFSRKDKIPPSSGSSLTLYLQFFQYQAKLISLSSLCYAWNSVFQFFKNLESVFIIPLVTVISVLLTKDILLTSFFQSWFISFSLNTFVPWYDNK